MALNPVKSGFLGPACRLPKGINDAHNIRFIHLPGVSPQSGHLVHQRDGQKIPITLSRLGQDPAQSSSIILTTVTDVVGFFAFLGIATLLAGML